ncbi:MAG: EAL domain-containing protein, partial [Pseudomonadota bacterium]
SSSSGSRGCPPFRAGDRGSELELESAIANGKVDGGNRPDFYALERSAPFKTLSDASLGALVEKAVRSGRVEIMLQPIVTLPQRKVRFYEAFARLRTSDGVLMQPGDFLDYAKRNGLMPEIDRQVVRRAVHVARRLISRSRDVGVFVNLDVHSLSDSDAASDVVAYLDSNRALSPSLIFEMTQDAYGRAGPLERALLEQITELGFRLSLDQVQRLDLDAKALADGKVRFAKVAAAHLLGGGDLTRDIHVADLSDLLARSGISLIAGHVEREAEVVDLLDYDVGFAQGFLFSPPRPVRGEGAPPDRAAAEPERVQRGASALAASRA